MTRALLEVWKVDAAARPRDQEGRGVIGIGTGGEGVLEEGKEDMDGDGDGDEDSKVLSDRIGPLACFAELEQEMDDRGCLFFLPGAAAIVDFRLP
jgi:hypothetical protein